MKKSTRVLLILLMTIFSVLACYLSLNIPNMGSSVSGSHLSRIILNFSNSLPSLDISHFFVFIFIFYFFYQFYFKGEKVKKSIVILSLFFSSCLVLGYSFHHTNSLDLITQGEIQIIKSIIKIIGYYFMIYILIKKLFDGIVYLGSKEEFKENKYLNFIFNKHPNLCITAILLVVWLPIIILFFPGIFSYDGFTQLKQIFGEYQAFHINIINPDVALNNHHPVFSTLLIGLFYKIGEWIHNVDIGIYLYVLVQLASLMYVLLYSFKLMRKMKISNMIQCVVLLVYLFCPLFLIFALNVLKDVNFSILMFYYILLLIEILIDKQVLKKKSYLLKLVIIMFLITMFRNNGIYTILLSFPFLMIFFKEYRKRILVCLVIPIALYMIVNNVIYPMLQISKGSIKEMLSIPFQQTARTLYEGKEYEQQDLEIINQILDVEVISKKYNPVLSDPVKNTFNKNSDTTMLLDYFKVWFKYLWKYPGTYVEATMNNCFAYLYPNKMNLVGYFKYPDNYWEREERTNMQHVNDFQKQRDVMEDASRLLLKAPMTGTLLSAGFSSWLLLTLALFTLYSKDKRFIIIYFALISILLVCIAAPYFAIRYMLSIVYSLPILVVLSIYLSRKDKEIKE